jgi:hypothetical protein
MEIGDEVIIPVDLTEWVGANQLREWISETVDGLNWDNPDLVDALRRHPDAEPQALLTAIVYAYLTGVYGSDEVVRLCAQAPELKPRRPKLPPLVEDVSAFRKMNRGVIHLVLVHVIAKVLKTQFVDGDMISVFPAGLRRLIVENAFERINIARHMDRTAQA